MLWPDLLEHSLFVFFLGMNPCFTLRKTPKTFLRITLRQRDGEEMHQSCGVAIYWHPPGKVLWSATNPVGTNYMIATTRRLAEPCVCYRDRHPADVVQMFPLGAHCFVHKTLGGAFTNPPLHYEGKM